MALYLWRCVEAITPRSRSQVELADFCVRRGKFSRLGVKDGQKYSPFAISFRSYVNFQPIEYTLVMLIDISCGCSECFVQNMPTFIVFTNLVYLDPNL